jgi:hypothetical protein
MRLQYLFLLFIISLLPYILFCGGTSETGNARIASLSGSILINDCDTSKTWVHLVNENYIPGTDTSEMVYKVAVDPEGEYHFKSVICNNYYIYIKGSDRNLLEGPFPVSVPEAELGKDTLRYTSQVTVNIPDSAHLDFVFIRGVPELYKVTSGKAVLPQAPQGSLEIIARSSQNSTSPLDSVDLKRTIRLDVIQGDTVSVGLHTAAPVFDKTSSAMSRTVNLDCSKIYQDVLLVGNNNSDSITFRILQAPSDLHLNPSDGVISWSVPDTFINRALTIGAVAENSKGSSRAIWWTVTFNNTCSLKVAKPKPPTGLDSGIINKAIYFYADSTDKNAKLIYRFHWGDSLISKWSAVPSAMHSWSAPGTYEVRIQTATTDSSILSPLSDPHLVSIGIQQTITPAPQPRIVLSTDTIPTGQKLFLSIIDDSGASFYTLVKWNDTGKTNWDTLNPSIHIWNKPGTYYAYVKAIYKQMSASDTLTDTCNICVVPPNMTDSIPPVITLFGESEIKITVSSPYYDSGATAFDDKNGDVSSSIKTVTNINISKSGTYYYLYTAKDSSGNVASSLRKIIIQ